MSDVTDAARCDGIVREWLSGKNVMQGGIPYAGLRRSHAHAWLFGVRFLGGGWAKRERERIYETHMDMGCVGLCVTEERRAAWVASSPQRTCGVALCARV